MWLHKLCVGNLSIYNDLTSIFRVIIGHLRAWLWEQPIPIIKGVFFFHLAVDNLWFQLCINWCVNHNLDFPLSTVHQAREKAPWGHHTTGRKFGRDRQWYSAKYKKYKTSEWWWLFDGAAQTFEEREWWNFWFSGQNNARSVDSGQSILCSSAIP